jgi:nitric oxide synthase-interacting protein
MLLIIGISILQGDIDALADAEKQSKLNKFLKTEKNIVTEPVKAFHSGPSSSKSVSNMVFGKDKQLPSFWVPSMTPGNKTSLATKPVIN